MCSWFYLFKILEKDNEYMVSEINGFLEAEGKDYQG